MSADNWAVCPGCTKIREAHIERAESDLKDAYGVVPVEEFDRRRAELTAMHDQVPPSTFREDYEIWGAEEGEFHVSYSGRCTECGLAFKFRHDVEDITAVDA